MAILRALGPRAEVVPAFLGLGEAVLYGPAALGRREREVLAVAASRANGAGYSSGVHAGLLEELGGAGEDERDRALVAFAERLTLRAARGRGGAAARPLLRRGDQRRDPRRSRC